MNLAGLSKFQSLTSLNLAQCRSVVGLEELVDVKALQYLDLENCGELEPQEALLRLNIKAIIVTDRNPFNADFRKKAEASATEWRYFGRARKPQA